MIDIDEHMAELEQIASSCDRIVEFGVRDGSGSTLAFIRGVREELISFDTTPCPCDHIRATAMTREVLWTFRQEDVLQASIPPCDLLFIDSLHTYSQLREELRLHADKSKRLIGFHDTETFGDRGEDGSKPGLRQAIREFLDENPHWTPLFHREYNNGMTFLTREDGE